jgi:hypothetical protein
MHDLFEMRKEFLFGHFRLFKYGFEGSPLDLFLAQNHNNHNSPSVWQAS